MSAIPFLASLASALPADEIAFGKWQKHAVYAGITCRTLYDLGLVPWGSYVVDDEPSAGYEAGHYQLVDFAVEFRGVDIGKAKRELVETGRVFEGVAMKDLD